MLFTKEQIETGPKLEYTESKTRIRRFGFPMLNELYIEQNMVDKIKLGYPFSKKDKLIKLCKMSKTSTIYSIGLQLYYEIFSEDIKKGKHPMVFLQSNYNCPIHNPWQRPVMEVIDEVIAIKSFKIVERKKFNIIYAEIIRNIYYIPSPEDSKRYIFLNKSQDYNKDDIMYVAENFLVDKDSQRIK